LFGKHLVECRREGPVVIAALLDCRKVLLGFATLDRRSGDGRQSLLMSHLSGGDRIERDGALGFQVTTEGFPFILGQESPGFSIRRGPIDANTDLGGTNGFQSQHPTDLLAPLHWRFVFEEVKFLLAGEERRGEGRMAQSNQV
jgi:hypothetical protein